MFCSTFKPFVAIRRAIAIAAATLFVIFAGTTQRALAQSETILYYFCSLSNCDDGKIPQAGLVMDASGNFYGTTQAGGAYNQGTAFKLSPDGTFTLLHTFGATANDGTAPEAPLILDSKGNLYGTTNAGGAHSKGTVFKLTASGQETILYNFCSTGGTKCTDGSFPMAGLVRDKQGNLYGTASSGGVYGLTLTKGVVFKLSPTGTEKVLHSFGNGSDGSTPVAGLIMDSAGNFYGTTMWGGNYNACAEGCGTVFKITPAGTETVLYEFCAGITSNCNDASQPEAPLLLDKSGNLYGTTYTGGKYFFGTVFRISPSGTEKIIHAFAGYPTDGGYLLGGVIMDSAGNLYGSTWAGGIYGQYGTVYKMTAAGKETILHNFNSNGIDGSFPAGTLIMDSAGNLYGTTQGGPSNQVNAGTIFKITP